MRFDLDALPQIGEVTNEEGANGEGLPLQLAVDDIDEDPSQPRLEFDDEPLQQLAASIAERGVLQAISVRHHPDREDRWMLNFGARRLRASRMAGRSQIPAFVNETANSYDQVIENEQREGLKPLELALFIQQRLAGGESQTDIARQLGKSRSYVTFATALIDAPDWLMDIYRQGRCCGMQELYTLRQLHQAHPGAAQALTAGTQPITRDKLANAKASSLRPAAESFPKAAQALVAKSTRYVESAGAYDVRPTHRLPANPSPSGSLRVWADLDGAEVQVLVDSVPPQGGEVFVNAASQTEPVVVAASRLRLLRIAPV